MKTSKKIKSSENFNIGLPSELCGFQGGKYFPPKSFKDFDKHLNSCYNGLFYVIGDLAQSSDFKRFDSKHICENNFENPLLLQVFISLLNIKNELRKNSPIQFERKEKLSLSIKGQINFTKTLIKNRGLFGKTFIRNNEINEGTLEYRFLKLSTPFISNLLISNVSDRSFNTIESMISEINFHLSAIDIEKNNFYDLAVSILKKRDLQQKVGILSDCKILAEIFISNNNFHSPTTEEKYASNNANFRQNDFLLNLNRPFENILKEIIERLPASSKKESKFSSIKQLNKGPSDQNQKYSLVPDAWKVLNLPNSKEQCLLIFDAKHKEFSNLNSSDYWGEDLLQEHNKINRNDLHQLISYIRTNLVNNERGIFGFFGYAQEDLGPNQDPNYSHPFINCNRDNQKQPNPLVLNAGDIKNENLIYINILSLRFGSLLSLIGKYAETDGPSSKTNFMNDLYSRLAIELIQNIYKNDVYLRSNLLSKTLNSCISGATRSLFFAYRDSGNVLINVVTHILKHFFLRSDFAIQEKNVFLLFNGKRLDYFIFCSENNEKVIVLDTDHDPSLVADENTSNEIFQSQGLLMVISKHSILTKEDGVAISPSKFLKS